MEKEVSLYIHIPFCISKCDYCDFFSVTGCQSLLDDYIQALGSEIEARLKEYGPAEIKSLYVGGGTPSLLSQNQLKKLEDIIKPLKKTETFEFTFEVNPDDVTEELLQALDKTGVNRISCGLQSFSQKVLENIHRRAGAEQVEKALLLLKKNWKHKLSVDLICGLPFESQKSMLEGLKKLCRLGIPHISFYSLCVEEETPLGQAIITNKIKYDYDFSDQLWIKGRDFLLQNAYEQYEVSNFCLPGYECLHNMTYWTHGDYIGIGSGASGTIYNTDGSSSRWTNTKDIKKYMEYWKKKPLCLNDIPQDVEKIEQETALFEYFMMALRTKRGISSGEYKSIFGLEIPDKIIQILDKWCQRGLCVCLCPAEKEKSYHLNEKGLLFLNSLLEELF